MQSRIEMKVSLSPFHAGVRLVGGRSAARKRGFNCEIRQVEQNGEGFEAIHRLFFNSQFSEFAQLLNKPNAWNSLWNSCCFVRTPGSKDFMNSLIFSSQSESSSLIESSASAQRLCSTGLMYSSELTTCNLNTRSYLLAFFGSIYYSGKDSSSWTPQAKKPKVYPSSAWKLTVCEEAEECGF